MAGERHAFVDRGFWGEMSSLDTRVAVYALLLLVYDVFVCLCAYV